MLLIAAPLAAQPLAPAATAVPINLQINPVLLPVLRELMAASPAFAAQCARIAEARHVRVVINPVMASSTTSRGTARTAMRRFTSGALVAIVDMPVPLTFVEYAELFGHELEHILEQVDGVDLAALTDARDGATRLADGAYETTRARRAGLLIADEIARPRPLAIVVSSARTPQTTATVNGTGAAAPVETVAPPAADPPAATQPGGTGNGAAAIRQF
jgi:hypothetical protein